MPNLDKLPLGGPDKLKSKIDGMIEDMATEIRKLGLPSPPAGQPAVSHYIAEMKKMRRRLESDIKVLEQIRETLNLPE